MIDVDYLSTRVWSFEKIVVKIFYILFNWQLILIESKVLFDFSLESEYFIHTSLK